MLDLSQDLVLHRHQRALLQLLWLLDDLAGCLHAVRLPRDEVDLGKVATAQLLAEGPAHRFHVRCAHANNAGDRGSGQW